MPHNCHRFWKCHKTITFCLLLGRCTIPCACHAKRHLNAQKWREHAVFLTIWLRNVLRATTACTFSTSQLPKVVRSWCVLYILTSTCASRHYGVHFSTSQLPKVVRSWCVLYILASTCFSTSQLPKVVRSWCVLYILTSTCASPHNGVHFFDISTSKSGPELVCFVHFHLEMCFAPQRRALFRHLNFQKWSGAGVFCTFWLPHVLRPTTACTFSTSQLLKVVRPWASRQLFEAREHQIFVWWLLGGDRWLHRHGNHMFPHCASLAGMEVERLDHLQNLCWGCGWFLIWLHLMIPQPGVLDKRHPAKKRPLGAHDALTKGIFEWSQWGLSWQKTSNHLLSPLPWQKVVRQLSYLWFLVSLAKGIKCSATCLACGVSFLSSRQMWTWI